jgi:hypothetical protein
MPSDDQELFQVPMGGVGAGIGEVDHAGQVIPELVEPPLEA